MTLSVAQLSLESPAAVYLLWGDDHALRRQAVEAIRKAILEGPGAVAGMEAFNHERFEGPYTESLSEVLTACQQVPMLGERRLVELSEPDAFGSQLRRTEQIGETGRSTGANALDALVAYMENPVQSTVLLLTSGTLAGTSKLVKAAKKSKLVIECRFQTDSDDSAVSQLRRAATQRGVKLATSAAPAVIARVGPTTAAWMDALEKIEALAKERGPESVIDERSVVELIERAREADAFSLTDAVGQGDAQTSLALLGRFFAHGEKNQEQAMRLAALLLWQVRRILTVVSSEDPSQLGMKPFVARKLLAQANKIGVSRLQMMHAGLLRLDRDFKGASTVAYTSPLLALQRWVLDACGALPGVEPRR